MKPENTQLGDLLKKYREEKFQGMGLRRVAKEIGIDYSHLFRIEAGQYVPSDDNLLKLASAYGLDAKQKLEVFNLARLTPKYQKVIDDAVESDYKKNPKAFVGAFYSKDKKK